MGLAAHTTYRNLSESGRIRLNHTLYKQFQAFSPSGHAQKNERK